MIIPNKLDLLDEECSDLSSLLESIAGYAIIEKATMSKTLNLRSQADVSNMRSFTRSTANESIGGRAVGLDVSKRDQSHHQPTPYR